MSESESSESPRVRPEDLAAAAGNALAAEASRTSMDGSVSADLAVAANAAVLGGEAARDFYGRPLDIEEKGREGPVTEADHASNRAIQRYLSTVRGDDPVLSEESVPPDTAERHGRLWVVDPLDGTKEFIAENGEFSVMVGLALEGEAALGAVYQPAVGRVFAGCAAGGAWELRQSGSAWNARLLEVERDAESGRPIRFVRSRSHPDERLTRLARRLGRIEEVVSGSVGIKCALVARGAADLYVHPVPFLKEWDTCAPEAVLRGAGGRVTDCAGERLRYGKPDPRQRGGIFAGTRIAWDSARPHVLDVARPMFSDRDESESV